MQRKKWKSWDEFVMTRSDIQRPYARLIEAATQCRLKTEMPGWVCFRDVPHFLPDNEEKGSKRLWMVTAASLGMIEKTRSYGAMRYRVKHMAQGDAQNQQPIPLEMAKPDTYLDWDPELPFADAEPDESRDTWPWDKTARRSRHGLVAVVDELERKREQKQEAQAEQAAHDWQNVPNERHPDGRHKLDFVWIGGGLADLHERMKQLEARAVQAEQDHVSLRHMMARAWEQGNSNGMRLDELAKLINTICAELGVKLTTEDQDG